MKRYVKITNKGTFHRLFLEIIGLGNKRETKNEDTVIIGQFHSGFKLATPAAIRMGIDVAISSADNLGDFVLTFDTQEFSFMHRGEKITDRMIVYKYSNGKQSYLKVALSAFPDWEKPIGSDSNKYYNVLREYIANARDEDMGFIIETGITEICQAPAGCTSLYIEQRPEILQLIQRPAGHFKFLSFVHPLFKISELGAIYKKSTPSFMRFFNQGYLIDCREETIDRSLYDYDAVGKNLVTETRTMKSQDVFDKKIAKLFSCITDESLLGNLLVFSMREFFSYESKVFGLIGCEDMSPEFKDLCLRILHTEYGDNILLSSGNISTDAELKSRGYKVLYTGYHFSNFLRQIGIKTADAKLHDLSEKLKFRDLTPEEKQKIEKIVSEYLTTINYYAGNLPEFKIRAVHDESGAILGCAANNYSEICIETKRFSAQDQEILRILIHEFRHCATRVPDSDYRTFMERADYEQVYLLQVIKIILDYVKKLGISPKDIGNCFG